MQSACLRCLNKITFLDFFKFRGVPKPKTGAEASCTGFSGSVLMVIIIIAYCVNATIRFLETPESVDVTHLPMANQEMNLMPTCISVPHLNDRDYFAYDFQQVVYDVNGTKNVIPIWITDNVGGQSNPDTFCINANATHAKLRGFCSPYDCSFVQFHLWTCGANDTKNPTQNSTTCKSLAEIGDILQTNYVDVTYFTELGTVVLHATPKISAACLFSTTFTYNETTVAPDLLRTFVTTQHTNLVHDADQYALSYFFSGGINPFKPVLEVRMSFSSSWARTQASHKTSGDLVSAFGAFAGVVNSVLAFVFVWYNERKFYAREPNWERIDDDFNVVPVDEEYVPTTSVGRKSKKSGGSAVKRSSNEQTYSRQDELNSVARESFSLMVDGAH